MNFIQKIKDYDFQKNMKFYYRESRDIWMSIAISKARELEFMEKVADNWQNKLVEANRLIEDIHNENTILGKRLKFSVGHNHIEIVVGNPTTYIENCNTEFEEFTYQWTVSRCSHKDTYNWKTGVIEALDNLCVQSEYSHKLQRDLRKALAKKYPEIFEVSK